MADKTDNHEYNVPNEGETDWHLPLNENFRQYDRDIEIRDLASNRGDYKPLQGAKLFADTGAVFLGDGNNWTQVSSTGPNPSLRRVTAIFSGSHSTHSALLGVNNGTGTGAYLAGNDSNNPAVVVEGSDASAALRAIGTIQFDTPTTSGSNEPMMYMYPDGTTNPDQPIFVHSPDFPGWGLFYNDDQDLFEFRDSGAARISMDPAEGSIYLSGDLVADGTKNFVQSVDTDDGEREVVYTASEAPTPHTELSGVAELEDGRAAVELPDHFGWVTDDDEPIVVQITPYGGESGTRVVERSTDRIVVEDLEGEGDYEFAYTVKGTREGQADKEVVRDPAPDRTAGETGGPTPADD